jgi:RNA polymerase sigma-70 factor (ECF subfamily)
MKNQSTVPAHDTAEEFVQLLTLNQPRIFAFVLALVPNVSDAEEIMQETSLFLWRRFAEFQPGTNFRAWACTIARYKILEFRRANPFRRRVEISSELLEEIADAAVQQADALESRRLAMVDCLQKLGARDRDLLERRVQHEKTVAQIGIDVGRSARGLYKAYERIYRTIHECIDLAVAREQHP